MRRFPLLLSLPVLAALLLAGAGCGLLSSNDEPLPGVYVSQEFRAKAPDGTNLDLDGEGALLRMTLEEDGRVTAGRFLVPGDIGVGVSADESFAGSYARDGDRVTFDFDGDALSTDYFGTGRSLGETEWLFFEEDELLIAEADELVLVLDKEDEVDDE